MGPAQTCPGVGNKVTTEEECRKAARDLRLPLGRGGGGHHGNVGECQPNCYVYANQVWFSYKQNHYGYGAHWGCAAVCRNC